MYILPIDVLQFPKINSFYLERELLDNNMSLVEILCDSSTKECTCITYVLDEYGDGDTKIYHSQYTLINKKTHQEINTTSIRDFRNKFLSKEYELTECDSLFWYEDTGFLRAVIYQAVITAKCEENLKADFFLCSYDKEREYLEDVQKEVMQKWLISHDDYRTAFPYTYATDKGKSIFDDKMMRYFKQKYYPREEEILLGIVTMIYEMELDEDFILSLIKEKTEYDPNYIPLLETIEECGIDTLDIPELNQLLEELYFYCMDSSNFDVHVSSIKILTPWTNGSESFGIRANLELLFKSNLTEKLHFNFDEDDKDCDIYDLCKAAVMGPSLQNTNCLVLCENETYPNMENEFLKDIKFAIKRDLNDLYDIPSLCKEHICREKWDLQSIILYENATGNQTT